MHECVCKLHAFNVIYAQKGANAGMFVDKTNVSIHLCMAGRQQYIQFELDENDDTSFLSDVYLQMHIHPHKVSTCIHTYIYIQYV